MNHLLKILSNSCIASCLILLIGCSIQAAQAQDLSYSNLRVTRIDSVRSGKARIQNIQFRNVSGGKRISASICLKGCPKAILYSKAPTLKVGQVFSGRARRRGQVIYMIALNAVPDQPAPSIQKPAEPAPTGGDRSPPKALAVSGTGVGMNAIQLSLSAASGVESGGFTCQLLKPPASIYVEKKGECKYAFKPKSHRIPQASLEFTVTRTQDGATSDAATISLKWSQQGSFIGDPSEIGAYRDYLTREEAYHLIRTANFGDRLAELTEIATQPGGLDVVIDEILKVDNSDACRAIEQQAIEAAKRDKIGVCQIIPVKAKDGSTRSVRFCTANDAKVNNTGRSEAMRWVFALRFGCNPMRERMGLLWHNHFPINLYDLGVAERLSTRSHYIPEHVNALRSVNKVGSYASIYELVARMHGQDGAMGMWLDNRRNVYNSSGGNENYARELLELMTLGPRDLITGEPNYSEEHIYDFRTALMGYSDEQATDVKVDPSVTYVASCLEDPACTQLDSAATNRLLEDTKNNPNFYKQRWNMVTQPVPVTLFAGQPRGYRRVFRANTLTPGEDSVTPYLMGSHPGVPRFFAARLIGTFVTTKLTEDMVAKVAAELVGANWDPVPALRVLFRSSAFYARANRFDVVNNPIEHMVTSLRSIGLPMDRPVGGLDLQDALLNTLNEAGYPLLRMPSIFGLREAGKIVGNTVHDGSFFLSDQRFLARLRGLPDYLNRLDANIVANRTPGFKWLNLLPSRAGESPYLQRSPAALLDSLATRMGLVINDDQRGALLEYLTTVTPRVVKVNNVNEVDTSYSRSISWTALSESQYDVLLRLKIPGLISILAALPQNNFR